MPRCFCKDQGIDCKQISGLLKTKRVRFEFKVMVKDSGKMWRMRL
jgi:hypothetical protein